MTTSRLEAFSDGVLAIILTVMLLGLAVPAGDDFAALWDSSGVGLLTYIVSFGYVGIYWNNHHHVFQLATTVRGGVLWANLHLLFWLSLLPLATAWVDNTGFARAPVMSYGFVLFAAAIAYWVLEVRIIAAEGESSGLRAAVGGELKGKISAAGYVAGIVIAWFIGDGRLVPTILAAACFVGVGVLWMVPDRRIERAIAARSAE